MRFTLDYSKWKCGGFGGGSKILGNGETHLWNAQGYGCCLGHFGLNLGITKEEMVLKMSPLNLSCESEDKFKKVISDVRSFLFANDGTSLLLDKESNGKKIFDPTPKQRLAVIRKMLRADGHTLVVINGPKKKMAKKKA